MTAAPRIAIAGNPNSGKTTIFNALTGLRHRVANYPGVTVEKREGTLAGANGSITLVDLPGAYGLSARSPDEEVARDVLLGRIAGTRRPDGVIIVVDASNLERNLYLASQILEFGIPTIIACNMMDVAEQRGLRIDCAALAVALGVPVLPLAAARGIGVEALRRAMDSICEYIPPPRAWCLSRPFEQAIERAAAAMAASGATLPRATRGGALLWLCDYLSGERAARASAERYLAKVSPEPANELRAAAAGLSHTHEDPTAAAIETRYAWISQIARQAVTRAKPAGEQATPSATLSDRVDHLLTHRFFGYVVFLGVMLLMFVAIFSLAEPLMTMIESAQSSLAGRVADLLPEGSLRSLLADGIIAGVGAVVIFFPQIGILFLCLAILEDSGYMARAAFLMDRLMSRVGLHGRSFIPLLCSYACAVPGIMATRTIENRRDRLTTILAIPFVTCSARLPVYLTVIGAVLPGGIWLKGLMLFGLYVGGTASALLAALILKRTWLAGPQPAFIMELPAYHLPQPWPILRTAWDRSKVFLSHAGTVIFCASVIIWSLSYFPRLPESEVPNVRTAAETNTAGSPAAQAEDSSEEDDAVENHAAAAQLRNSFLGRLGQAIEPLIEPLGFDWRIGTGLLSSFLAREVFVSTMGITLAVGDADSGTHALREKLASATWPDGRRVLTPLVGCGLMVFYVLACQCVSTLAVVRKETGSWRWPLVMLGYMTALAYVAALLVFQIGSRLGIGA